MLAVTSANGLKNGLKPFNKYLQKVEWTPNLTASGAVDKLDGLQFCVYFILDVQF